MINLHLKVDNEIELKIPKEEDAIPIFLLVLKNREWLGTYLEWVEKTKTPYDILNFFKRHKHLSYYDEGFPLIIWFKEKPVGVIGFHRGNSIKKEVEIGYWIAEEYSRNGVVTRATQALINLAFNMTDIKTIFICCEISNIRSYRIPQKLGFEFIKEEEESDVFKKDEKGIKLTYRLKKPD